MSLIFRIWNVLNVLKQFCEENLFKIVTSSLKISQMFGVIVLSCQFSSECQATYLLDDELVHGWCC